MLPRIYKPAVKEKRYALGIIPHYIDLDNEYVRKLSQDQRIKLIKVQEYRKWTDFIDEICSCEFVVSSSLHGLVTAEAYGIPSKWVLFGSYADGWEFKFLDFYESIGKLREEPFNVDETTCYEHLVSMQDSWKKGYIDLDKLYDACPIR